MKKALKWLMFGLITTALGWTIFADNSVEKVQIKKVKKTTSGLSGKPEADSIKGTRLNQEYLVIPFASFRNGTICDHLLVDTGTIEFWLKVDDWEKRGRYAYPLFFWGAKHFQRCLIIRLGGKNRSTITFSLSSDNNKTIKKWLCLYKGNYKLKPNTWHHVACCWDIRDGKEYRDIFLDGKRIDQKKETSHQDRDFTISKIPTPLYIGTMKKESNLITDNDVDMTISQFRISGKVRYQKEFIPDKRIKLDSDTLIYFPFEDGVEGYFNVPGEKKPSCIKARRIKTGSSRKE